MDFGKNVDGECIEGDHMVIGEIGLSGTENTVLNYLPCRDAVRLLESLSILIVFNATSN